MPDEYRRNYAKNFAFQYAGKTVNFVEIEGQTYMPGRVVGYYEQMAQVVLECAHLPRYPIDPMWSHLKPTFPLEMNRGRSYVCVSTDLIRAVAQKSTRFPHKCPRCTSPAFILFRTVECSRVGCENCP